MSGMPYEIFIEGETIDLMYPSERAVDDGWHHWFNDPKTTRWLDQGAYPNTRKKQMQFLADITSEESDRLALMIVPKNTAKVIGVVSLSGIGNHNRTGQAAMVIGNRETSRDLLFHGLEAKARITEHAFEVMGLERVWGNQAVDLERWQRYQVLFGFRPEGIMRNAFRKGHKVSDTVVTSCLLETYLEIRKARKGVYWPGKSRLYELMRLMPDVPIVNRVADAIHREVDDYLSGIPMA